eukprot:10365753-Ditylum_brightwellii.AAC.1
MKAQQTPGYKEIEIKSDNSNKSNIGSLCSFSSFFSEPTDQEASKTNNLQLLCICAKSSKHACRLVPHEIVAIR